MLEPDTALGVVWRRSGEVLETSLTGVSDETFELDVIVLAHTSTLLATPFRLLLYTMLHLQGSMSGSKGEDEELNAAPWQAQAFSKLQMTREVESLKLGCLGPLDD